MAANFDSDNEEDEEEEICPTCIEPLNEKGETKLFFPCPCNYRICMFCVRRIMTEFDGRCPGCRRDYDEGSFRFVDKPIVQNSGKNARQQNSKRKGNKFGQTEPSGGSLNGHPRSGPAHASHNANAGITSLPIQHSNISGPNNSSANIVLNNVAATAANAIGMHHVDANGFPRKDLSNVRVVQRNLVYLVGLAPSIAKEETLRSKEFFGQYGKIVKVAINRNDRERDASGDASRPPSFSAYITFAREEDAKAAIKGVNGLWLDNYVIKASFGTTKYCNMFLRGLQCTNPDCLYLHKLGDEASSFTKEEMQAGRAGFHDMTQLRGEQQRRAQLEGLLLDPDAQLPLQPPLGTNPPSVAAVVTGAASAPPGQIPLAPSVGTGPTTSAWAQPGGLLGSTSAAQSDKAPVLSGGWAAAAAGGPKPPGTTGSATHTTSTAVPTIPGTPPPELAQSNQHLESLVPPKGFNRADSSNRGNLTRQQSAGKPNSTPSPPPGLSVANANATATSAGPDFSEPISLLAELGGLLLEVYMAENPAISLASERAPGPKNSPRQPFPEQTLPTKDRMQEEIENARKQVLLQRVLQQQKALQMHHMAQQIQGGKSDGPQQQQPQQQSQQQTYI